MNLTMDSIEFWKVARSLGGWFTNAEIRDASDIPARSVRHHTTRMHREGLLVADVTWPRRYRPADESRDARVMNAIKHLDRLAGVAAKPAPARRGKRAA